MLDKLETRQQAEVVLTETRFETPPGPRALPARPEDAMACLVQMAQELHSAADLDAGLRKVAEQLKEHIDYDTFAILLLDDLGQELRFRFGIGFSDEVMAHWRFGLGQGLVGSAAKSGQPVLVGDVSKDPRYIHAAEGVGSELAIPLIAKNRTIGVLDVQCRQLDRFEHHHQRMLSYMGGHLADAIETARLHENMREQARTLSLLHEASRELTSILDREELLRRVAQLVKRLIDYQLFCVMLWSEEKQLLEHTFSQHFGEQIVEKDGFPLGYGICGTVAALRQPLRVPNVQIDPRYVRCGHEIDVKSELTIPLVFKDRLIGVLDLESTEYNAFTERHEQMLSTLASCVAIAFENARLYQKLRSEEQRLERDLETARETQKHLLPQEIPSVAGLEIATGYLPARQLGGDIYDFLPYEGGRLAIAVGDVAGKATPAALYGSLAVGIMRGHVVQHPCEPAEMLEHLNEHLHGLRIDNRYVALVYSLYDSRRRTLTVANSGFPRPLLLRGGQAEEIPVEGVPLGMLPGTRYEQKELALQPDDVVVFCSDGIYESTDTSGREFGKERLQTLLVQLADGSADEIASGLLRATASYVDGRGEQHDDRTVVVLKVQP
jgi:sigma-B regulation protein RsbU (phosphoserine phosphatase)